MVSYILLVETNQIIMKIFIMLFNIHNFLMLKMETLVDHIKFDHGYTAKSPVIINVSCFLFLGH